MKRLTYIIMAILAIVILNTGCSKKGAGAGAGAEVGNKPAVVEEQAKAEGLPEGALTNEQATEQNAIVLSIQAHFAAFEREDLDKVAATLHPESPQRNQVLGTAALIFDALDGVEYDLAGCDYKGNGVMSVTQITKGKNGTFRDNTVKGVWTYKKDDAGEWKFWKSVVNEISYHDTPEEEEEAVEDENEADEPGRVKRFFQRFKKADEPVVSPEEGDETA